MTSPSRAVPRLVDRRTIGGVSAAVVVALVFGGMLVTAGGAQADAVAVPLGTADSFAVLAGSTVTNTGPSTINGDLGLSPGTAVTGFPPGTVQDGTIHAADAVADQAKQDLVIAYNAAAGQPADFALDPELGGETLKRGVYNSATTIGLTGTVTLDAEGDPDAVWVFQAGSTLITASSSTVALINGAQSCNVFWQVGSSATLGTGSTFRGTVLALTSISLGTGTVVDGRMLARNGAVTLDTNTITRPTCAPPPTTTPPTTTSPPTTTPPTTTSPPTTTPPTTTSPPTTTPPTTTSPPTTTPPTTTSPPTTTPPTTTSPPTTTPPTASPTPPRGPQVPRPPVGGINTGDGSTSGTGSISAILRGLSTAYQVA